MAARAKPGRPAVLPEEERRRRLFDAAAQVFIGHGYASATMAAIAAGAGMSKKTLYQLFPSKLALFDALLDDRIFQSAMPEPPPDGTQAERLTQLLLGIADVLLQPDRTGLLRLIVADGQAFPELMTAFERLRMENKINALTLWLEREQAMGAFPPGDVRVPTQLLFGMTVAEPILQALINAPRDPAEPTLEERIRAAVGIFLRGAK